MNLPSNVAVIGGGRMGAGIAYAFLTRGADVVLVETGVDAVEAARGRVQSLLDIGVARGGLAQDAALYLSGLTVTHEYSVLAEAAAVIEAVPEDEAIKSRVLAEVESHAAGDAVLASNTSSLSIDTLAKSLNDPRRFLGLHFFNPVPASDLVEIVVGTATSSGLVRTAQDWIAALGKTAITVSDSPGFASSRLGVSIALEAMRMLDEGVATVEDIDTAMMLGYRHPTGPLKTTDLVGLDVRLAIAEHLERELGARFAPPRILRDKVYAGDLGKKTGRGFYNWVS